MVQTFSYLKLIISIIFIISAVFGFTYAAKWYSTKYNDQYTSSGAAIDAKIQEIDSINENDIKGYTELQKNANTINNLLFVLFFLAVIVFLIFWLIIMLRRAILDN